MNAITDHGYRLHCWHGCEHAHASREEALQCIIRHQPGLPDARSCGCNCLVGYIHMACPLHSPRRSAFHACT
jgi:hypothetical protein